MDDNNNLSFLTKGSIVEVTSNEGDSNGAWYVATVINPPTTTTRNNLVYVEYHNLSSEHGSSTRLREYANIAYVRPSPAPDPTPHSFNLNDVVDAFYRDAWWTGVVTAVVDLSKFLVSFKNPPQETQFEVAQLRVHKKWVDGKWLLHPPNQGDTAVRTTHSSVDNQIEKATPITGKVSPVATSVMKSKQQNNIDSSDKTSPNGEIMNDDSVKKMKHPSVDQFENFDTEVSGMTDQAVSKKSDTAKKTACSLVDNQIEQATPIIGKNSPVTTITTKRKRQKNLDSNDETSPNVEIINDVSVTKNKHASVDKSEGFDSEVSGMTDQAFSKKDDAAEKTAHSLVDNQIEQSPPIIGCSPPIIGKQSPVATSNTKRKRQKNLDVNDKTSPSDVIMNDDSSEKKKQPSVGQSEGDDPEVSGMGQKHLDGNDQTSPNDEVMNDDSSKKTKHPSDVDQSEGFDSEVSGMPDQALSKTENLPHGKKVHSKRGKSIELKAPTTDSSKKRGMLIKELKSLQASTKGGKSGIQWPLGNSLPRRSRRSPLITKPRTQETVEKENATKDVLFVVLGLHCTRMIVSQGNLVQNLPDEKNPEAPLTPLVEDDQEGSEVDAASVALKRRSGRLRNSHALSPKTPVTGSGTDSLEENQGNVNEQPGLAGKQIEPLTKDKLPNKNPGQDLHVQGGKGTKKHSARKSKRGKRQRTISINAESPVQVFSVDSQHAPNEKADENLEKDSTTKASVGKSLDTNHQPISKLFEGNPSSMDGLEGTVEQSSKASEGWLNSGNFPFIKSTALWKALVSMEAFQKLPQKPHFRPLLEGVKEGAQEGLAIGAMVTFSTMVDKTSSLKYDDPRSTIDNCLEILVELESNGFDVEVIRKRLTGLLLIKDKHEELKGQLRKSRKRLKKIEKIEEEIEELNRQMREFEERRKQALLKKEKRISELSVTETLIEGIKQEIREVGAEFDGLAAAPLVV